MLRLRPYTILAALALAALLLPVLPASAQQRTDGGPEIDAFRREIETLKRGQFEILRRLEALQKAVAGGLLRGQQPSPPFRGADILIEGAPAIGSPEAKLAIIEFSDYQCPFCRRFYSNTLPLLREKYLETGKLRYVFRDFPIQQIHPAAVEAAIAARCAGAQGQYWQMHDRFFQDQQSVAARAWRTHAEAIGLDLDRFQSCLNEDGHAQAVRQSLIEGSRIGITGTPAFFLGTISADGKSVKATEMIRGARPFASFEQVIDRLIAEQSG